MVYILPPLLNQNLAYIFFSNYLSTSERSEILPRKIKNSQLGNDHSIFMRRWGEGYIILFLNTNLVAKWY